METRGKFLLSNSVIWPFSRKTLNPFEIRLALFKLYLHSFAISFPKCAQVFYIFDADIFESQNVYRA